MPVEYQMKIFNDDFIGRRSKFIYYIFTVAFTFIFTYTSSYIFIPLRSGKGPNSNIVVVHYLELEEQVCVILCC